MRSDFFRDASCMFAGRKRIDAANLVFGKPALRMRSDIAGMALEAEARAGADESNREHLTANGKAAAWSGCLEHEEPIMTNGLRAIVLVAGSSISTLDP